MDSIKSLVLILVLAVQSSYAYATNGFHLEANGPISKAMGGTGVADDIGNYALMYNPATLALMPSDTRISLGLDVIIGDIDIFSSTQGSIEGKTQSNNRNPYIGPALSYAKRIGKSVYGLGLFVEGGIGTEYGSNSFLSSTPAGFDTGQNISSRLLVLRAPIGMSFKLNDKFSIGGSFDLLWNGWNMDVLLGVDQIGALAKDNRVSGAAFPAMAGLLGKSGAAYLSSSKNNFLLSGFDSFGWSGKLGFTYQITDKTRLGLVYSLKTRFQDAKGDVKSLLYASGTNPDAPVNFTGKLTLSDFQMPAWFAIGFNYTINEKAKVNFDVRHIQYADSMKNLDFKLELDGAGDLSLSVPQNWEDITVFSVGGAYQYSKNLILRLGASFANNPVNENYMLHTLPPIVKTHLMSGFTYQLSKNSTLDFVFSWAVKNKEINRQQPFNGNGSANPELTIEVAEYNFQLGYSWLF